jgi:hypothetical protein
MRVLYHHGLVGRPGLFEPVFPFLWQVCHSTA